MSTSKPNTGDLLLFSAASLAGFFLFLGSTPILEGAEALQAEMAREMALTADYLRPQLYFEPHPWHPPLMLWLQALAIEFLGTHAWAVRLPSALLGFATVLQIYTLGVQVQGRLFGRIAVALYLGCLLAIGGGRLGLSANAASLFLLLAFSQWLAYERLPSEKARKDAGPWAAGFWLGLASLSAGPWIFLLGVAGYLLPRLVQPTPLPWLPLLKSIAGWLILCGGWYGMQALLLGEGLWESLPAIPWDATGMQQAAGIALFLLAGIPLTMFLFRARFRDHGGRQLTGMASTWLLGILLLMLIFPGLMEGMILLAPLPAALLAALAVNDRIVQQAPAPWESYVFAGLALLLWGLLPSLLNLFVNNLDLAHGFISEPGLSDRIKLEVGWQGWEWLIGAVFLLGLMYNLRHLRQKRYVSFVYLQMVLGLLFVLGVHATLLPKLTRYTQGPVEDFFRARAGQDYYVLNEGPESALPWFYGQVKPIRDPRAFDRQWLVEGEVNKEVFLVAPTSAVDRDFRARYRGFQKLYEEGGYAFFIRKSMTPTFGEEG